MLNTTDLEELPSVIRHSAQLPTAATVIIGFQGWSDVSGAALEGIDHLREVARAERVAEVDPESYYDFQVNQPRLEMADGRRSVVWRTTELYAGTLPGLGDVLLVRGIEPSFRWKAFVAELLDGLAEVEVTRFVFLGVVPGEIPHTRPFPVGVTSPQEVTRVLHTAQTPTYEGPIGIIGVLIDVLAERETPLLSLWVEVPQYATGGPAPKAALALVSRLGSLLEAPLPLGDLEESSRAWERGVSELVEQDGEMASYVDTLEHAVDVTDLPEASGDAIAEEFTQFLRRRDDGQDTGPAPK